MATQKQTASMQRGFGMADTMKFGTQVEAVTQKITDFPPGTVSSAQDVKEQDRLKLTRDYFETGCSCILVAKTLQPCSTNMPDAEAVAFYELNCNCSRNYQHLGRKY